MEERKKNKINKEIKIERKKEMGKRMKARKKHNWMEERKKHKWNDERRTKEWKKERNTN